MVILLLLTLATGPLYKFDVGTTACIYRIQETVTIRHRATVGNWHWYYVDNSRGVKWRAGEMSLKPGKCDKR